MIGDPTRARMLSALMGGQYLAAGELAAAAGVTAQTASAHVAKLVEADLVVARSQGRHRYFRLADADIGHALEALSLVAERSASADKWEQGAYKLLKAARTCYSHLAGELGVQVFDGLLRNGVLSARDGYFVVSDQGRFTLASLGLAIPELTSPVAARKFAYPCLDWSERRDHLAGGLAVMLLEHFVAHQWLRRIDGSRALRITPEGSRRMAPLLEPGSHPGYKVKAATASCP